MKKSEVIEELAIVYDAIDNTVDELNKVENSQEEITLLSDLLSTMRDTALMLDLHIGDLKSKL